MLRLKFEISQINNKVDINQFIVIGLQY